jgi:CBS domain-containing protein
LVDEAGRLAGLITRGDIMRSLQQGSAETTPVLAAGSTAVAVAHPDETLRQAIARMLKQNVGRLPVVERSGSRRVIGYLGREDILAARVRLQEEEELREQGPLLAGKVSRAGCPGD